ncbi:MAG: hypothetical protein V2B19_00435 [Pseudomonadota bacterium]
MAEKSALISVSATPGHFFQPGKNLLSLKQLAGLPKKMDNSSLSGRFNPVFLQSPGPFFFVPAALFITI